MLKKSKKSLGLDGADCIPASAKKGIGVPDILAAVVERMPAPQGDPEAPLQALIFDAVYDEYRGIIIYFRVVNGSLKRGDNIRLIRSEQVYEATEVGRLAPKMTPSKDGLAAGEVGYLTGSIKALSDVKVGDTITLDRNRGDSLPGFREMKSMVFCGLYPSGETTMISSAKPLTNCQ